MIDQKKRLWVCTVALACSACFGRPDFNPDKPDTEGNKKAFKDFLKVDISPDVRNIYCFDDAVGIDADYQFSFNCLPKTAQKIIRVNGLVRDTVTKDFAFGLQNDFDWWNKEIIGKLDLYSWKGTNEYYKYFWYDHEAQQAYFFDFDM